jgi:DNA-binding PadR family transcriptional regulator
MTAVSNKQPGVEQLIPLKPVDFLVLMTLAGEERHGYGIVKDIEEHTGGTIRLVPGNLYSVLRRLMDVGLLAEGDRRDAGGPTEQRRRYYQITPLGVEVLRAEAERLRDLVSLAQARQILPEVAGA